MIRKCLYQCFVLFVCLFVFVFSGISLHNTMVFPNVYGTGAVQPGFIPFISLYFMSVTFPIPIPIKLCFIQTQRLTPAIFIFHFYNIFIFNLLICFIQIHLYPCIFVCRVTGEFFGQILLNKFSLFTNCENC